MHTITLKIYKVKDEEINLNGQWVQETSWKESYGLGIDSKLKGTRLSIGEHMYSERKKCKVSKIKKIISSHFTLHPVFLLSMLDDFLLN